jgi:hypothetical protein
VIEGPVSLAVSPAHYMCQVVLSICLCACGEREKETFFSYVRVCVQYEALCLECHHLIA